MDFYQSISQYYDYIFPLNERQVTFITESLNNEIETKGILDIGCSTGSLSIALSELGARVTGIDLDPEMIRLARLKGKDLHTDFKIMDMTKIDNHLEHNSFDLITCFGNTIVHLLDPETINTFFIKCKKLLRPRGKFLLQVLNYDHILDNQIFELPPIDNSKIRFERRYSINENNLLNFNTILTIKETGNRIENTIPLLPLRKNELDIGLRNAGFSNISYFSAFDRSDFSLTSLPLVVEAK